MKKLSTKVLRFLAISNTDTHCLPIELIKKVLAFKQKRYTTFYMSDYSKFSKSNIPHCPIQYLKESQDEKINYKCSFEPNTTTHSFSFLMIFTEIGTRHCKPSGDFCMFVRQCPFVDNFTDKELLGGIYFDQNCKRCPYI